MERKLLVRYGAISEVARFRAGPDGSMTRGERVVVRSHRGIELGTLLESAVSGTTESNGEDPGEPVILRPASPDDERTAEKRRAECEQQFGRWCRRIHDWGLDLQLIDLERTLDGAKLILYVLNQRGSDCTQLALQAAAAGLGTVDVQPVDAEGLVQMEQAGGGCGTGGCGCRDV